MTNESPPTLRQARELVVGRLNAAGVPSPEVDAALLLEALTGLTRAEQLLAGARPLSAEQQGTLLGWLERRGRREPLQHILGRAHFYGLVLEVGPAVLVPRPETERLVEIALERLEGVRSPKVLDVGTGSGAIALALGRERPDADLMASDISPAALEVARRNAERCGVEVTLVRADLLDGEVVSSFARRADALLANPPYLPEGDRARLSAEARSDPAAALFSGADGLEHFRRLERQARRRLPAGAFALVELDPRNVRKALAESGGWSRAVVTADLAGRERFLLLER